MTGHRIRRQHRGYRINKRRDIFGKFFNKDEIAVEAFEYAGQILMEQLSSAINNADTAIDKIMAVCNVHIDPVNNPPLKGGCPLLNTAVERR